MPSDACRVDLRWLNLVTAFNMVFNTVVSLYLLELLRPSYLSLFLKSICDIYSQFIYEKELVGFGFGIFCTCTQIQDMDLVNLFIGIPGSTSEP